MAEEQKGVAEVPAGESPEPEEGSPAGAPADTGGEGGKPAAENADAPAGDKGTGDKGESVGKPDRTGKRFERLLTRLQEVTLENEALKAKVGQPKADKTEPAAEGDEDFPADLKEYKSKLDAYIDRKLGAKTKPIEEKVGSFEQREADAKRKTEEERAVARASQLRMKFPKLTEKYGEELLEALKQNPQEYSRDPDKWFRDVVPEDEIEAAIASNYELERQKKLKGAAAPSGPPSAAAPAGVTVKRDRRQVLLGIVRENRK